MRPILSKKATSHIIQSITSTLIFLIGIVTNVHGKTVTIEDGLISYWSFDNEIYVDTKLENSTDNQSGNIY
ncbi:hypothetical protein JT359_11030 [Candidatus Poribacteria bacterium]|nr:hypothetical protein [Candidatus Poribacteria bacterium]